MIDQTTTKLLADAVSLIKERHQDLAARHLTEWDGQPNLLVIEEPVTDPADREALEFVKRHGRKAGVRLVQPVENTYPGTPAKDDPQVEAAMRVWDSFNDRERRNVFSSLCRAAIADERAPGLGHMSRLAECVRSTVRMETANPALRQKIRDSLTGWHTVADATEVAALIAQLEES